MIEKSISELVENRSVKLINVPIFQRPYSWSKEEISDFQNDLDNCLDNKDQEHFFWLIVYVANSYDENIIDIIDWQQRLTTIIILLSVLRDFLEDYRVNIDWDEADDKDIAKEEFTLNKILAADLNWHSVKLYTENENNYENEFLEVIQLPITDLNWKYKKLKNAYDEQEKWSKDRFTAKSDFLYYDIGDTRKTRHKTSYKNYVLLHTYIDNKISLLKTNSSRYKFLIKVYKKIIENFKIIPFKVDSYAKAFEYFEVLNDRWLDVSALDLIKNRCLQIPNITAEERDEVFSKWTDIFSNTLDHTYNLIQFVRYAYMSDKWHITNKEIYKEYKNLLDGKNYEEIWNFLDEDLLIKATIYKDLNSKETILDARLHNAVNLLKSTKTIQWFSIAIAALYPEYNEEKLSNQTKEKIIELFEVLHELMFTLNFVDKVANDLEKKLPEISSNIDFTDEVNFCKTLDTAISEVQEFKVEVWLLFSKIDLPVLDWADTEDEIESKFSEWSKSFEKNNSLWNMFLFFIKYKHTSTKDNKINVSSLEHTLPQKPTQDKWTIILGEEDIDRYKYSLWNFFIVHTTDNSSYWNKSFSDKKKAYLDKNVYDIISESDELNYKKLDDWNLDIIKKRERKIIQIFQGETVNYVPQKVS